eukprot:3236517-Amphidinium_carterae.1
MQSSCGHGTRLNLRVFKSIQTAGAGDPASDSATAGDTSELDRNTHDRLGFLRTRGANNAHCAATCEVAVHVHVQRILDTGMRNVCRTFVHHVTWIPRTTGLFFVLTSLRSFMS